MTGGVAARGETRRRLREDAARLRAFQKSKFGYRPIVWFVDPAWVAVLLYRLSAAAWSRGHHKGGRALMQLNSLLTGVDIHPASDLGPGLLIPSPCGVTISCKAGRNLTILALSGLGGSNDGRDIGAGPGLPVLGDDVVIGPFCGVQNGIHVGDGATIEGGAGALKDVPPGGRMVLATAPHYRTNVEAAVSSGRVLPACPHGTWRRTKSDIRGDVDRYMTELSRHHRADSGMLARLSAFLTNPVLATLLYRVAHWQHAKGRVRVGRVLANFNLLFNKVTITSDSCIGGGLFVPHLGGTLFRGHAGSNLTLYANSLCGPLNAAVDDPRTLEVAPILGDHVTISGHSSILGPVTIGDHVRLAAKVQAMRDLPEQVDVFSPMARFTTGRDDASAPAPIKDPGVRESCSKQSWRATWRTMAERSRHDRVRLASCVSPHRPGFPGRTSAQLHRISHAMFVTGHLRFARWAWLLNVALTGADISPASDLGPGLVIPHPAGICIHGIAGRGLTLLAQSGIGPTAIVDGRLPPVSGAPLIGDNVHLSHHSGIFGASSVGDRVYLTAGCIATRAVGNDVALAPRPLRLRPADWQMRGNAAEDDG